MILKIEIIDNVCGIYEVKLLNNSIRNKVYDRDFIGIMKFIKEEY